jgi:hypothetical protein
MPQLVLLKAPTSLAGAQQVLLRAPINPIGVKFKDDDYDEYHFYLLYTFGN